jgi:acetolactate synthase-1/2/3 large subunit
MPDDNVLAIGCVNFGGFGDAYAALESADVVLVAGSRLRYLDFKSRKAIMNQVIHLDGESQWIDKNYRSEIGLVGDVKCILEKLCDYLKGFNIPNGRFEKVVAYHDQFHCDIQEGLEAYIGNQYLDVLRTVIPQEGILTVEPSIFAALARTYYPTYFPGGLILGDGSTIIGFSFPAAIGAKLASPERPVVAMCGDGGFLYCSNELATCVRHMRLCQNTRQNLYGPSNLRPAGSPAAIRAVDLSAPFQSGQRIVVRCYGKYAHWQGR